MRRWSIRRSDSQRRGHASRARSHGDHADHGVGRLADRLPGSRGRQSRVPVPGWKPVVLSHDQTLAQALADNGIIRSGEVETHRFSNVLVSALGCTSNMEPLYGRHELQPNDKLMICSDGLTKHVRAIRSPRFWTRMRRRKSRATD